jgi:hydroxymethylpyrimidine/phosphomethylpyrimidine kinase
MSAERKFVMSIAGLDPSGGAGLLADMKTFEQHKVYGLSVNTANTLQTTSTFHSIWWTELKDVLYTIDVLLKAFPVQVIKTGIVPSFDFLLEVVTFIQSRNPEIKIIVDPVLRSTSGFDFYQSFNPEKLDSILDKIFLLTPNIPEALALANETDADQAALKLSGTCHVLLKGGHHATSPGIDFLYYNRQRTPLNPLLKGVHGKHGSGCVLSAAIAANLALGADLLEACTQAKLYIEKFLSSNSSRLGYHHV